MLNTQNKVIAIPNYNKKMTQKYKKEEKANKYVYRVPYQKNKTLNITETRDRFLVFV